VEGCKVVRAVYQFRMEVQRFAYTSCVAKSQNEKEVVVL
jgi:hypothetical protein